VDPKRLEALPLFRDLSRRDREKIARWADEVDLPAGYHLLDQGRLPHEFFVIEEGDAEVVHGGKTVATLGAGDFFGEIALIRTDRRTASVVAKTPMKLIVVFGPNFRALASDMPRVADKINATIEERCATM
jgi:CRP-like cAMP-binding protein